jgi:enamine deaminase RidA (YjgF/YER057c/UK114 family)
MSSRFRGGSRIEAAAGYARAARYGPLVAVSATAAIGDDGHILYPENAGGQARVCFERALAAAAQLGAMREDVIRTRIYLAPDTDWRAAVDVHCELFRGLDPANTTYFVAGFIPEGALVEVELDAYVLERD